MGTFLRTNTNRRSYLDVSIVNGDACKAFNNNYTNFKCTVDCLRYSIEWLLTNIVLQLAVGHGLRWYYLVQFSWL